MLPTSKRSVLIEVSGVESVVVSKEDVEFEKKRGNEVGGMILIKSITGE